MGPQICSAFSGSPYVGNVSRTTVLFLWSHLLMSHLNERSVVTEMTEVHHLSNLELEGEFNYIYANHPQSFLKSHSTLPTKITKLHGREQHRCFLERTPGTKLCNFHTGLFRGLVNTETTKRGEKGKEARAGCLL